MTAIRRTPFAAAVLTLLALHSSLLAAPIRFLPWDDGIAARKIGFQNDKGVTQIPDLHPNKRSAQMDATVSEKLPLQLVALDRTSPDGKPVTVEIKVPPAMQSPLVLILPDPKNPSGMRPFVIEDNASNFGWGTVRFINATGKALLIRHDKTIKALPEAWTPVDVDPGGSARNIAVQLVAKDDPKTILYSAIWEHHLDIRKLVFAVPGADAGTGAVEFKIIPEDRRALAAAAAQPPGTN